MLAEPRPYGGDRDWRAMLDLLVAGRRADNGTYYVHTGDVSWWLYYHDAEAVFADRIRLWERDGQLLGWALFTPEERFFDLFVHPELRGAPEAEAMHAWAEAQITAQVKALGGQNLRTMWISETDAVRRALLERHGFTHGGYVLNYMEQALTEPGADAPFPDGFEVRPVAPGEAEAEARARASYGAFQSSWEWAPYLARYRRFARSPVYERERDLVAAAPDGRIAAFAIWWPDEVNGVGLFEPVGTHPDFQRRGLGRAVVRAGLRAMWARGLARAIVCSASDNPAAVALYEACGFRAVDRLLLYEKPIV